jgi:hypothetical protein
MNEPLIIEEGQDQVVMLGSSREFDPDRLSQSGLGTEIYLADQKNERRRHEF